MTDAFVEYIERKIKEETEKRDKIGDWLSYKMHPEDKRIWWAHEGRRQAYEDSLVQYKLCGCVQP